MFANHNTGTGVVDERSVSGRTVDGEDLESQRSLLTKLHHAAYCFHDGRSLDDLCPKDRLCCASKRIFQHMSGCSAAQCDVPCCKSSRRIWKHYRKCRQVENCPLCSVVPSAFTPEGIAPRFSKLSSTMSVVSIPESSSLPSLGASSVGAFSVSNASAGQSSTAAIVSPSTTPPSTDRGSSSKNNIAADFPRGASTSTPSFAGLSPKTEVPWEDPHRPLQLPKPAPPSNFRQNLIPPTPPTPPSYPSKQQQQPRQHQLPPKPLTPTPYHSAVGPRPSSSSSSMSDSSSRLSNATHKPPLSPRRPQWALF